MKLTYEQRFREAIVLLVGHIPPADLISDWINRVERDDDLQQWVGCSGGGPWWAQTIAILDAAKALAISPIEGKNDEIDYNKPSQPH